MSWSKCFTTFSPLLGKDLEFVWVWIKWLCLILSKFLWGWCYKKKSYLWLKIKSLIIIYNYIVFSLDKRARNGEEMRFTNFMLFNLLTSSTILMIMMETVKGKPSIFLIETADTNDDLQQDAGDDYWGNSGVPVWIPKANGRSTNMANALFGWMTWYRWYKIKSCLKIYFDLL